MVQDDADASSVERRLLLRARRLDDLSRRLRAVVTPGGRPVAPPVRPFGEQPTAPEVKNIQHSNKAVLAKLSVLALTGEADGVRNHPRPFLRPCKGRERE